MDSSVSARVPSHFNCPLRVEFGRAKEGGEAEILEILLAKAVGSYLEY